MKREIRKKMLALRRQVKPDEREKYSHLVCKRLLERFCKCHPPLAVAVYLATDDEISLDEFIASVPPSIRIAAPRWNPASRTYELATLVTHPLALTIGHWGIREPSQDAPAIAPHEIDAWLVPGLAFSQDGKRLGYGGGYYDKFLAAASPDSKSIGIAYPFQILDALPAEEHDKTIDEVLIV